MKRLLQTMTATILLTLLAGSVQAIERQKLNFNAGWRLCVGDVPEAVEAIFDDSGWQQVSLPYAFNGHEAFRKDIVDLTDTICWYRKTFEVKSEEVKNASSNLKVSARVPTST